METTEQVKTYLDFWYSPLLIFSLISDRRVNYVRKPSHLINVGFDQQCFQDFRTTFFPVWTYSLFYENQEPVHTSVFLPTLRFWAEIHARLLSRLDRDQYFMRGANHTRPNHSKSEKNIVAPTTEGKSLQFRCRSDCGTFSSDINVANQEIFLIGWKRFLGRKVLISVVIWIQRATDY